MVKKSLYILLTSILGIIIFLILHRSAAFIYLYLSSPGSSAEYFNFLVWDFFSLIVTLILGAWYGIWLGLNWFDMVYVNKTRGGFVDYVTKKVWPTPLPKNFESKMSAVKERLEKDLSQIENLAEASFVQTKAPQPRMRRVVRKTAPKKLKSLD